MASRVPLISTPDNSLRTRRFCVTGCAAATRGRGTSPASRGNCNRYFPCCRSALQSGPWPTSTSCSKKTGSSHRRMHFVGRRSLQMRRFTPPRSAIQWRTGRAKRGSSSGSSRGSERWTGRRRTPSGSREERSTSRTTVSTGTFHHPRNRRADLEGEPGTAPRSLLGSLRRVQSSQRPAELGVRRGDRVGIYLP